MTNQPPQEVSIDGNIYILKTKDIKKHYYTVTFKCNYRFCNKRGLDDFHADMISDIIVRIRDVLDMHSTDLEINVRDNK